MATRRRPGSTADPVQNSVTTGLDNSATVLNMAADLLQVRDIETTVVQPYLSTVIPNLIADVRPAPQTIVTRSDSASQVITVAKMLRGGVFVNYMTTPLYLQIHGVTPAPAAAVQPQFPPIPVAQNQVFIIDQALLGYDGFGYNDCTIRVSSTLIGYSPTANTAGLWAMIARFK